MLSCFQYIIALQLCSVSRHHKKEESSELSLLFRWKLKSSCYHWSSSTEADSEIPSVGRFLVKFYTMAKGHQKHQKTVGKIPGRILEERFLCCILFLPTQRFLRLYNLRPLLLGQRTSLVWYLALSGSPPYFSGDKEH